jgi:hypothetical protein
MGNSKIPPTTKFFQQKRTEFSDLSAELRRVSALLNAIDLTDQVAINQNRALLSEARTITNRLTVRLELEERGLTETERLIVGVPHA